VDPSGLWAWDDDWIELGLGGLLGLQGQQVQEGAGAGIAGSWLFKAPGKISTIDPTPISGTVDTLLVGTLEGRSAKAMAAEIACEVMPGPNPRKAKRVVGAIDKCATGRIAAPVRIGQGPFGYPSGTTIKSAAESIAKRIPASEKQAKDIAKRIERELGKDARRAFHDAKEGGMGDRTMQELLDDARSIFKDFGKEIPRWLQEV
jgi:hypothetical protein